MLLEEMVTTPSPNQAAWAVGRALARVTIDYENKGEEMMCWVSGEVRPRTERGLENRACRTKEKGLDIYPLGFRTCESRLCHPHSSCFLPCPHPGDHHILSNTPPEDPCQSPSCPCQGPGCPAPQLSCYSQSLTSISAPSCRSGLFLQHKCDQGTPQLEPLPGLGVVQTCVRTANSAWNICAGKPADMELRGHLSHTHRVRH